MKASTIITLAAAIFPSAQVAALQTVSFAVIMCVVFDNQNYIARHTRFQRPSN